MTKRVIALLFVALTCISVSMNANARKFGGGRSWGHHYNTSRSYSHSHSSTSSRSGLNSQRRWGFGHGLLGGLLAGGLLGSLFGGHGGFGFGHLILWFLIGWLIWRAVKALGFRGGTGGRASQNIFGGSGTASSAPEPSRDLPPNFDVAAFLDDAQKHYHTLQTAWNYNDQDLMVKYLVPELARDMMHERDKLGTGALKNRILYVDPSLVRSEQHSGLMQVSVHYSGQYITNEGQQQPIDEIWHMQRDMNRTESVWMIEGIEEHSGQ